MKRMILAALGVCLVAPGLAAADPIGFTLFGGNHTSVNNGTTVTTGLIGSNGGVTLGGGANAITVVGAGALGGGNSIDITAGGNVIFNGDVIIGGASHVTGNIDSGGNVQIGNGTIVDGSIRAAGTVSIGGSATVGGDIDAGAGTGQAVSVGNSAHITGTITTKPGTTAGMGGGATAGGVVSGTPDAPTPYVLNTLPTTTVFAAGATSHSSGGGSTLSLAPGAYNDIHLGNTSVLNLTSGTYYFDTWDMDGGLDINFDLAGGDVLLYFTGNVQIGNGLDVNLAGGDASDIYAETHGNWKQDGGGQWFGTIFGSGATSDVTLGNDSTLTGALWATHNVVFNGQASFMLADQLTPNATDPTPVPEPASMLLLGAGLTGMAARRRLALRRRLAATNC